MSHGGLSPDIENISFANFDLIGFEKLLANPLSMPVIKSLLALISVS